GGDAAHRVAEEVELRDAERLDETVQVGDQVVERVRRLVVQVLRLRMTPVVVANDASALGQSWSNVVPVTCAAGVTVDQDEGNVARALVDDVQFDPIYVHAFLNSVRSSAGYRACVAASVSSSQYG